MVSHRACQYIWILMHVIVGKAEILSSLLHLSITLFSLPNPKLESAVCCKFSHFSSTYILIYFNSIQLNFTVRFKMNIDHTDIYTHLHILQGVSIHIPRLNIASPICFSNSKFARGRPGRFRSGQMINALCYLCYLVYEIPKLILM